MSAHSDGRGCQRGAQGGPPAPKNAADPPRLPAESVDVEPDVIGRHTRISTRDLRGVRQRLERCPYGCHRNWGAGRLPRTGIRVCEACTLEGVGDGVPYD